MSHRINKLLRYCATAYRSSYALLRYCATALRTNPSYCATALLTTALILLPVFDAQANPFSLSNITYKVTSNLFAYSLQIVFSMIGTLMGTLVQLLDWTVNMRIYTNVPVIQESWKIMRDFANMLFIIALIVMAYGTIFNIPKYDFKSLIPRFIVVAVLINFSLILGGLMIDATQVLNNTFLSAMGDISGQLGQGLNVTALLPDAQKVTQGGEALSNLGFSIVINLLFGIFMVFAIVVSVAVPLVVAFVRIPILWALLIVSPMAWLLSILPATKGTFDKWWHQFLGWNLFLPYYLFSLYFALYFLGNTPRVIEGLGQTFVDQSLTGLGGNFTFSLIFSYVLVAVFLIGGTKVAMSAGQFSGTGIVGVAKWGRSRAMRLTGAEGWRRGGLQKWQETQKEGYGFGQYRLGGEKALEAEALRRARMLGTKGALEKGVEAEEEKQKSFAHDIRKLEELSTSGSTEQRIAARKRLTNLGAQTPKQIQETYRMLGGDRGEAANKYITGIDSSKYTKEQRREIFDTVTNVEARQKIADTMIEKGEFTQEEIQQTAQKLFQTRQAMAEFIEKGRKKNLIATARAKAALGLLEEGRTLANEIADNAKKITDTQILELNPNNFEVRDTDTPEEKDAKKTLMRELGSVFEKNPKRLENITRQATGELRGKFDIMIRNNLHAEALKINADVDSLRAKRAGPLGQVGQIGQELADIQNEISGPGGLESQINPNDPNPNSDYNKQIRTQISQLEKQRETKEKEVRSLQEKVDKINERIETVTSKPGTREGSEEEV